MRPHLAPTRPTIEYVSYADATGYGQAAIGYVRLLYEAGFDVHWTPFLNDAIWAGRVGPASAPAELARGRAALLARVSSAAGTGLRTLVEATARPVPDPIRILHLLPRFWPMHMLAAPGACHVGMTVWETDRVTEEWMPALCSVDHLIVPSTHNAQVLADARTGGAALPAVSVVPHVCRPILQPLPPARLAGLAKWLRIELGDTVFYTINAWDPRKRLANLIESFARQFDASEKVVLVVKTNRRTWFDDPASPPGDRDVVRTVQGILARVDAEMGRPSARISLIADDEVSDGVIDGLHTLGHCFVSFSRCEGFGLGCFDAATQGRPVIAVGYGGPVDYLGQDWPGRIRHRMVPCAAPPGFGWFDAGQCWPEPDDAAATAKMRAFVDDARPFAAEAGAQAILDQFGDAAIRARLRAAIMVAMAVPSAKDGPS